MIGKKRLCHIGRWLAKLLSKGSRTFFVSLGVLSTVLFLWIQPHQKVVDALGVEKAQAMIPSLGRSLYRKPIVDRAGTLLAYTDFDLVITENTAPLEKGTKGSSEELARNGSVKNGDGLLVLSRENLEAYPLLAYLEKDAFKRYRRRYPYDPVMTPILGFVDRYGNGLNGVEFQYDSYLKGSSSTAFLGSPPGPPFQAENRTAGPAARFMPAGDSLALAVDRLVQIKAFQALTHASKRYRAARGCLVIMDAFAGDILAMAQIPSLTATRFWDHPEAATPPLASSLYFQPWALAAASIIEEDGKSRIRRPSSASWHQVTPEALLLIPRGQPNLSKAQIFTIPLLSHLGLGQKTGIDLPGEKEGCIGSTSGTGLDLFQNIKATPLQILRAYAMLTNGGIAVTPHLTLLPGGGGSDHGKPLPKTSSPWYYAGALYEKSPDARQLVLLGRAAEQGKILVFIMALDEVAPSHGELSSVISHIKRVVDSAIALPPLKTREILALYGAKEGR